VNKVKGQMQEAAKLAISEPTGEEEEEEDDEDDEPPPGFFEKQEQSANAPVKARQSVSAEAYGEWNAKKAFVPPVNPKTDEQKERLKNCLTKSFMFTNLESTDLGIIIGAMKELIAQPKERLIKQGDAGDFLFVVESGKIECSIDGKGVVKTCEAGDVFGELALLYNCPRAAHVDATEKSVLWQLDRDTFSHIVKEAAQKKRVRYDAFLQKVPLLASMDAYERSQLADALKVETFDKAGTVIVSQGEEGKKFYILEDGEAVATKNGTQVMSYNAGDYFGELALIRNQPRAATITTKTDGCRLLSLDSGSFKRLLKVNDLLERANKYA